MPSSFRGILVRVRAHHLLSQVNHQSYDHAIFEKYYIVYICKTYICWSYMKLGWFFCLTWIISSLFKKVSAIRKSVKLNLFVNQSLSFRKNYTRVYTCLCLQFGKAKNFGKISFVPSKYVNMEVLTKMFSYAYKNVTVGLLFPTFFPTC